MKKYLTILIFLTGSHVLYSQNAFYDAIKLTRYVSNGYFKNDENSRKEYSIILNNYLSKPKKEINFITIANAFTNKTELNPDYNPFLEQFFDRDSINLAAGSNSFSGLISGGLSSVGNLDVTNIADGLARFLIKRGQEELSVAFFQRMNDFLQQNIEARTLFPATTTFLQNIAAYRYSEFLQSLREAFFKDLSNLIVNLNILIDLPKYQELLKALPEIRVAIRSSKIISELSQVDSSVHPANLISQFANLKEWDEISMNLGSSWKVLDKISESVRRVGSDMDLTNINGIAWIKFSDFNGNILQNESTLKIYLGLLYQKMRGISFRYDTVKTISVQEFMNTYKDDIFKIADLAENFLLLANDVDQSVKDIRQKEEKGLTNDDYYTYIGKAINICEYGFKVANIIKEGVADDRYIVMARNANNLYKNIYTKNYNGAVMNAYDILQEVLVKSKSAVDEKKKVLENSSVKNPNVIEKFSAEVKSLESSFMKADSIVRRSEIVGNILKYGNLMASIVKADNPQDAEAAIEAAVLPAGSSSIKKNTEWNISLNAYVGAYFATNYKNETTGNGSNIGVTGLVGVAVSKGLGHYRNGSPIGAISLYGSLIDIGAIVGYELNNDSTALNQKITLGQIFSPGGYLVYGIGLPFKAMSYIPISVGYGYQYGPSLYYKKADGTLALSEQTRWRSNWFVAVDIPLVNFWTKNYRKQN
jgi:hypothetical protein